MKALTLYQPWATLIGIGAKRIETRSWPTRYRGILAIHAGLKHPRFGLSVDDGAMIAALRAAGVSPDSLAVGAIVAVTSVIDCVPTETIAPAERLFGDFRPHRWAWLLGKSVAVPPQKCVGNRGLWNLADSLAGRLVIPAGFL